jgi:glutamate dehydrogenase/leucine dehydrogenase
MTELAKYIGNNIDIPAGDIGTGSREIGYMFGQYKRLKNEFVGVLTGKEFSYGGSLIRPEATGYGCVYFVEEMLKLKEDNLKGKVCVVSGSGNVAQFAARKLMDLGAKVVTLSDSGGYIYDPDGLDDEKWGYLMKLKNVDRGRISKLAEKFGLAYYPDERPWKVKCDVALPCATQNEVDGDDAEILVKNGVQVVAEGANMPCTPEAIEVFAKNHVLYAPGKASNAGGVAVSGLEMAQNSIRYSWSKEEVDKKLRDIMKEIHKQCVKYGQNGTQINYMKGANIAGFVKVADAMLAQGLV